MGYRELLDLIDQGYPRSSRKRVSNVSGSTCLPEPRIRKNYGMFPELIVSGIPAWRLGSEMNRVDLIHIRSPQTQEEEIKVRTPWQDSTSMWSFAVIGPSQVGI